MFLKHNKLFLFGWIYYLFLPFFVAAFGFLEEKPGMDNWYAVYWGVPSIRLYEYFFVSFLILVCFLFGGSVFNRKKVALPFKFRYVHYEPVFVLLSILIFLISISVFYSNFSLAFSGYSVYDYKLLGFVGTLNVISTFFLIYLLCIQRFKSLSFFLFSCSVFILSVFLLGLGSRMYVLLPLISIIVYFVNYSPSRVSFLKISSFIFIFLILMLAIGVWRVGLDFDFSFFVYIFLAEPIFTAWSTVSFLSFNELELFVFPYNYFTSFLNFIPTALFEEKSSYIVQVSDYFYYHAPLGADSIFVSLVGNFGVIGSCFYAFIFGFYYSILSRLAESHLLFRVYYICLLSVVPFQFFRDNFSIINKQVFWNMLFVPVVIFVLVFTIGFILKNASFRQHNI